MSVMKLEQPKFENQNNRERERIRSKISKYAVRDATLTCDAKALYGLFSTYSIYGNAITAGTKSLCKDLNVGSKKLYGLLFELTSQGYIEVTKGRFAKNNYKIAVCPEKYTLAPKNDKDRYAYEKIREGGIQSYGYGIVEQRVLRDPALHITAKSIYTYFCALSGNTSTAYPSVQAILRGLNICESTYYKYIRQLVEKGYVQVIEHKSKDGKYSPNEYRLLGHPNAHMPSNYRENIAAVNQKMQEHGVAEPSGKQTQPSPKSDTRSAEKKTPDADVNSSAPYPKNGTRQKNKKQKETGAIPSGVQPFGAESLSTETQVEPPCLTEPSATSPSAKNDRTYKKNTVNNNSQKENTLNQAGKNFEKKLKPSGGINQSTKSEKSDSIEKKSFENISVNADKIHQDVQKHRGIPMSYLKSKASLAAVIKTLSANAETSKPKMSNSQEEFLISKGLLSANAPKPEENKLRRLFLKCLIDMLHDSDNPYRKYNPEEVAGLVNAHIKFNNGAASFDNWLEQFEKSFMQSVSRPEVGGNIKSIYAYAKTSLWKFLKTYNDFHFHFHFGAGSETKQSSFNSDMFVEKMFGNAAKLLQI